AAIAPALHEGPPPALSDARGRLGGVDEDARRHGLLFAVPPRLVPEQRPRFEASGWIEAARRPGVDLAFDAVEAERPLFPAIPVVADDVPVTTPEEDPPRIHVPALTAIGERDGGSGSVRVEQRRQRRYRRERRQGVRGFALAPAELQQRLGRRGTTLEAYGRDGNMQRRLLVRGQVERRQVVLVGRGPIALLGTERVPPLEPHGDADPPQRVLVALELPAVRHLVVRIAGNELDDLLEGERPPRVEQRRDQVGEALEPVRHRCARAAARAPAAPAARNRAGSSAAGRPIDTTSSACSASKPRTSGDVTSTRSWRAAMPASVRSDCRRASSSRPRRGTATVTRSRHASRNAVRVWCDRPMWRALGSANDTRRQ